MDHSFGQVEYMMKFPRSVFVSTFFASLLGETSAKEMSKLAEKRQLSSVWSEGQVFFSHVFRCTEFTDTAALLQQAFRRGMALFLEDNCVGADILIPIYLPETNKFSCIIVQVKNRKGYTRAQCVSEGVSSMKAAFGYLNSKGFANPYFGLMMSLREGGNKRAKKNQSFVIDSLDNQRLIVGTQNINNHVFPHLFPPEEPGQSSEFYESLRFFRDAKPGLPTKFDDPEVEEYAKEVTSFAG